MSVCAVMLVKDEVDIIQATIEHLLTQVDEVRVMDNASTDGTGDILQELALAGDIHCTYDPEVAYYQSTKMTRAAQAARKAGHDWVVPCDADEIWLTTDGSTISERLGRIRDEHLCIITAELFDHRATDADDENDADPVTRMGYRDIWAGVLPKVAARLRKDLVIEMGNHAATFTNSRVASQPGLEVRHFPYRTLAQFVSKARNGAAAYAATDLPDHFGTHWRGYGRILDERGEDGIREVWEDHFYKRDPDRDMGLTFDPALDQVSGAPKDRMEIEA